MSDAHLDHPGEVHWYCGHGPAPVLGECPHDCKHMGMDTVAEGPDFEHYVLVQCFDCGCRGWKAEYPISPANPIPYRYPQRWLRVDLTAEYCGRCPLPCGLKDRGLVTTNAD